MGVPAFAHGELRPGALLSWSRRYTDEELAAFEALAGRVPSVAAHLPELLVVAPLTKLGGDVDYIARKMVWTHARPVGTAEELTAELRVLSVAEDTAFHRITFDARVRAGEEVVLSGQSKGVILKRPAHAGGAARPEHAAAGAAAERGTRGPGGDRAARGAGAEQGAAGATRETVAAVAAAGAGVAADAGVGTGAAVAGSARGAGAPPGAGPGRAAVPSAVPPIGPAPVDQAVRGTVLRHRRTVTDADILRCADLTGDRGEHHTTGLAGRRMAQGLLTALAVPLLRGDGGFRFRSMSMVFLNPVFAGDVLDAEARIEEEPERRAAADGSGGSAGRPGGGPGPATLAATVRNASGVDVLVTECAGSFS
ncbi:hypothetical protein [Streptomyces sp. NPDC018031]|uniref:hypothetical protein n=1 Tax=Streptomyces sp. NPDC018031 TaxID=3365033 RepID=UPI0037AF7CF3